MSGHPLPASLLRTPRQARRIPLRPLHRALASSWVESRRVAPVALLVSICATVGWLLAVVGLGFSTVTSGRFGSTLALGWVVFWSLPVIGEVFAGDVESRSSRGLRALPFGGLHQLVVRLAICVVFVLGLTLFQSVAELLTWIVRGRPEAPWTYFKGYDGSLTDPVFAAAWTTALVAAVTRRAIVGALAGLLAAGSVVGFPNLTEQNVMPSAPIALGVDVLIRLSDVLKTPLVVALGLALLGFVQPPRGALLRSLGSRIGRTTATLSFFAGAVLVADPPGLVRTLAVDWDDPRAVVLQLATSPAHDDALVVLGHGDRVRSYWILEEAADYEPRRLMGWGADLRTANGTRWGTDFLANWSHDGEHVIVSSSLGDPRDCDKFCVEVRSGVLEPVTPSREWTLHSSGVITESLWEGPTNLSPKGLFYLPGRRECGAVFVRGENRALSSHPPGLVFHGPDGGFVQMADLRTGAQVPLNLWCPDPSSIFASSDGTALIVYVRENRNILFDVASGGQRELPLGVPTFTKRAGQVLLQKTQHNVKPWVVTWSLFGVDREMPVAAPEGTRYLVDLNGLHWLAGGRRSVQVLAEDGSVLRTLRGATSEGNLQ